MSRGLSDDVETFMSPVNQNGNEAVLDTALEHPGFKAADVQA